jgi:NADPH-dependent FMN reductase
MKSFSETTEEELMLRIAIIIGSTRPGRNGEAVGKWVYKIAQKRSDAEFELVDIKDFNLPLLDEPMPPIMGQYSKPHTKAWAAKIDSFDAYVFVTPEYMASPARSRTRSIFSSPSGTTRRLASSATAEPVERARSSSSV